jgi:UDP-glucose:(heptosyl)LPS alpha-1,3-glucosyltransferase
MNIAFAIEHFSPEQGGAERYAWGLAQWLSGRGHTVDVYARRVALTSGFAGRVQMLDTPETLSISRQAAFAGALTAALRNRAYDVVQGFNHVWPCDVLRLGGGVHLAFEAYNAQSAGGPATRIVRRLSHGILPRYRSQRENEARQFDDPERHFIAVSQRVADDMTRHYPSVRDRIHLIYNGVDTAMFNPGDIASRRAAARARWGLDGADGVLLFASNNFRLKGLAELIRALPAVPSRPRLLVAGRGHAEPFTRLARRLGLSGRVTFCGSLDDPRDAYAAADALVHPSYYDAFGFVGLEAMACGLPVVISRNCGVSELMTPDRGAVLIQMPCAPAELAGAISRALEPRFRNDARICNRSIAEQHSLEDNYRLVLALYEQIGAAKTKKSG